MREMEITVHYTLPLKTTMMKALAHRNQNQNAKKSIDLHNNAITEINNNHKKNMKIKTKKYE